MKRAAARLEQAIAVIGNWCVHLGCLATAGIVVLLAGSSIKRYLLGTPIPVTEEWAGLLFVVTSFAAMTYGYTLDRQIRVLVLWRRLPTPLNHWMAVAGDLLAVLVLALIARETTGFARFSFDVQARTEVTDTLMWPWMMALPVTLGLFALAILARALTTICRLASGETIAEQKSGSVD